MTTNDLDHDFGGKLAVVVGGNQGIGAAIAAGLARAGSRIVIVGRDQRRLVEARKRVRRANRNVDVDTCVADVSSIESIANMTEHVMAEHGAPAILVNSAGGTIHKPAFEVTVPEWDQLINTHLRGTFFVSQAFGQVMAEMSYGKIINMSSTWASTVQSGRSVYATAKAGVSHLTSALAIEWATYGIRVNAIAPGPTMSPRVRERMNSDPEAAKSILERIPLGRFGTPEDIVGAAIFLASPASDFVTGHTLYVDGGWRTSK